MSGEHEAGRLFEIAEEMLCEEEAPFTPVIIRNKDAMPNEIRYGITPRLMKAARRHHTTYLNADDFDIKPVVDIKPVINAPRKTRVNIGLVLADGRPAGFMVTDYFGGESCNEEHIELAREPGKPVCNLFECDNAKNAALWLPYDKQGEKSDLGTVYVGSRKDFGYSRKRPFFDKRHKRECVMPGIAWKYPKLPAIGCLGDKTDVRILEPMNGEFFLSVNQIQQFKTEYGVDNPACDVMAVVLSKYLNP